MSPVARHGWRALSGLRWRYRLARGLWASTGARGGWRAVRRPSPRRAALPPCDARYTHRAIESSTKEPLTHVPDRSLKLKPPPKLKRGAQSAVT